jgi:hypothetical protein
MMTSEGVLRTNVRAALDRYQKATGRSAIRFETLPDDLASGRMTYAQLADEAQEELDKVGTPLGDVALADLLLELRSLVRGSKERS